jgi:hypothetical protein
LLLNQLTHKGCEAIQKVLDGRTTGNIEAFYQLTKATKLLDIVMIVSEKLVS